jgi:hypothetical protein
MTFDPKIKKLIDAAQGYADYCLRSVGHVRPSIFTASEKEPLFKMTIYGGGDFSPKERDKFATICRLICGAENADCSLFCSEGWYGPKTGDELEATETRPEGILLSAETRTHCGTFVFPIRRFENGAYCGLDDMLDTFWKDRKDTSIEMIGRFSNLLPLRDVPDDMQRAAKAALAIMGNFHLYRQ